MHIQATIVRAQAGVGHVLKAVTESPVRSKIPIQADMARELNIRAEVPRTKGILAKERWADPPLRTTPASAHGSGPRSAQEPQ